MVLIVNKREQLTLFGKLGTMQWRGTQGYQTLISAKSQKNNIDGTFMDSRWKSLRKNRWSKKNTWLTMVKVILIVSQSLIVGQEKSKEKYSLIRQWLCALCVRKRRFAAFIEINLSERWFRRNNIILSVSSWTNITQTFIWKLCP